MTSNFQQFINDLKKTTLSSEEKALLRAHLISEMGINPEPTVQVRWSRSSFHWRLVAMPLVAVLVIGGTVSASAAKSLPGQFLYSVKLSVNEELGRWVNFSLPAEIAYETKLLTRRLEEAEQLDNLNQLDQTLKSVVRTNVVKQRDKLNSLLPVTVAPVPVALSSDEPRPSQQVDNADANAKAGAGAEVTMMAVMDSAQPVVSTTSPEAKSASATQETVEVQSESTELPANALEVILEKHQSIIDKLEIEVDKAKLLPAVGNLKDSFDFLDSNKKKIDSAQKKVVEPTP